MLFLRTLLIVIFCVFYSWVCAAESFKLTCDFGQGWDEFTPRVQTHIVINDKGEIILRSICTNRGKITTKSNL